MDVNFERTELILSEFSSSFLKIVKKYNLSNYDALMMNKTMIDGALKSALGVEGLVELNHILATGKTLDEI